jgi:hypothetical protein
MLRNKIIEYFPNDNELTYGELELKYVKECKIIEETLRPFVPFDSTYKKTMALAKNSLKQDRYTKKQKTLINEH